VNNRKEQREKRQNLASEYKSYVELMKDSHTPILDITSFHHKLNTNPKIWDELKLVKINSLKERSLKYH
jgi:hypothetical protein